MCAQEDRGLKLSPPSQAAPTAAGIHYVELFTSRQPLGKFKCTLPFLPPQRKSEWRDDSRI